MGHGGVSGARDDVRLEGAPNFRGLGGLTALDGRRVRPRMLFRSEGPAHFSESDTATLRGLGIRTVCDLRSDAERSAHPNHWCGGEALLNIDIAIDVRVVGNQAWDLMRADPTPAGGRAARRASEPVPAGAAKRR
jgi:protein-tyrosine phosphatase